MIENIQVKISEMESSFYNLESRPYSESRPRNKRQVFMLLGGALIGRLVTSLYNQFTQASLVDILNEKTNIIASRVETNMINIQQNTADIQRINATLGQIKNAISAQIMRDKEIDLLLLGIMINHVLQEFNIRVSQLQEGLDHVFISKFHRDLVPARDLQEALKQIKSSAAKKGLLVGASTLAAAVKVFKCAFYDVDFSSSPLNNCFSQLASP
jgi:hypothetical protein